MITAFYNNKGGAGKTTSTVNVAASIALRGFKVLLIDIDAQHNATSYCGCKIDENSKTIFDVIFNGLDPHEAIYPTSCTNLYCLPSSNKMLNASTRLNLDQLGGPSTKLYMALKRSKLEKDFDYILIDCPSELDTITANALNAANNCIIPCNPDVFSQDGLVTVLEALDKAANNGSGTEIELSGAVICNYRGNTKAAKEGASDIFDALPDSTYPTRLKQAAVVPDSMKAAMPVVCWKPKEQISILYKEFADEYMRRHPVIKTV